VGMPDATHAGFAELKTGYAARLQQLASTSLAVHPDLRQEIPAPMLIEDQLGFVRRREVNLRPA
jgi:hypothetical protein